MLFSRRRFIAVSAAATASALLPGAAFANAGTVRWSGIAMGASASLSITGVPRGDAEALIAEVRSEIERLEAIFSLYRPDSAITRLNRDGALIDPPFDLLALLSTAKAVHEATGGAFDPTIQPVWALLAQTQGAPDHAALEQARSLIGLSGLRIDTQRIAFARPGMAITLNGIAQGYATDIVAARLKAAGLKNVLISMGEIAALGMPAPDRHWQVGIAENGDGQPEERIALQDAAIATTAPLGTVLDGRGRVGHLVDPRHGSSGSNWRRLSVLNGSAAIADGLSTGFALMSAEDITCCASRFPGSRIIAVASDGACLQYTA